MPYKSIGCILMASTLLLAKYINKDVYILRLNEADDMLIKKAARYISRSRQSRSTDQEEVSVGTFMLVNEGAIDLYKNFIHYFNRIEGRWEVYIGTTGKSVVSVAKDAGHHIILIEFDEISDEMLDFGNEDYQIAIYARTKIMNVLLNTDSYSFWLVADVDAVWLCNPYDVIINLYAIEQFEIGGQMDGPNLCGGFLFLRASMGVRLLWQNVTDTYYKSISSHKVDRSIENTEQGILNKLLNKKSVAVKEFDRDIFPSGDDYFVHRRRSKACVVHNNYIIGIDKKIQRFKEANLWQVAG